MGRTYWEIASTPREFKAGEEVWILSVHFLEPERVVLGTIGDKHNLLLGPKGVLFTKQGVWYLGAATPLSRSLFTREEIQELGLKIEVFHPVPDWVKFVTPPIGGDLLLYSKSANAGFSLEGTNYRRVIIKALTNAHLLKVKLQEVPYSEIAVGDWFISGDSMDYVRGKYSEDKELVISIDGHCSDYTYFSIPPYNEVTLYKIVIDED